METTNTKTVQPIVSKLVAYLSGCLLDLNTELVRIKRTVFRDIFGGTHSSDPLSSDRMFEIHTELLEQGYLIVSVGTGENTEYFMGSTKNKIFLEAKTHTSEQIEQIVNKRSCLLKNIRKLLDVKLSPNMLARSVCDLAGHSNLGVVLPSKTKNKEEKSRCIRCGSIINKPRAVIYTNKRPTKYPELTGHTANLIYTPYYEISELDLIGLDLDPDENKNYIFIVRKFLSPEADSMLSAVLFLDDFVNAKIDELQQKTKREKEAKSEKTPKTPKTPKKEKEVKSEKTPKTPKTPKKEKEAKSEKTPKTPKTPKKEKEVKSNKVQKQQKSEDLKVVRKKT